MQLSELRKELAFNTELVQLLETLKNIAADQYHVMEKEKDRAKLEHKCFKAAHELIDKGMRESFASRSKKKRRRSAA
jgi:hypothetical protein